MNVPRLLARFTCGAFAAVFLAVILPASASAQTWPLDSEWVPALINGIPVTDPCNDSPGAQNEKDVVGDILHPAYFMKLNGDFMYFRIRVDADPRHLGGLSPFGWAVLVDSARTRQDWEYQFIVNGIPAAIDETVTQFTNLTVEEPNAVMDPPDEPPIAVWPWIVQGRTVPADTSQMYTKCNPDQDWFMDMWIPTAALFAVPEWFTLTSPIHFVLGTSASTINLNADACAWALPGDPLFDEASSDPVCLDTDGDLIDNCTDNCITVPNLDQANFDEDAWGDACDGDDDNDDDPDITDCEPFNPDIHNGAMEICNQIDDDCNGEADDGLSQELTCGTGACFATGWSDCIGGITVELCVPGLPTGSDIDCNGQDDNCDGSTDEGFTPVLNYCGVGDCSSSGTSSCEAGVENLNCVPGEPTGDDSDCDGWDDDCDGYADNMYVPHGTSCGTGACANTGTSYCEGGYEYDGCEINPPESYYDYDCDAVDDNCNGSTDEEYVSQQTFCGTGACESWGYSTCESGAEYTNCDAGDPTGDDTDCDSSDDDCDGYPDDGYVGRDTECGVGACYATGITSCVAGDENDSCVAGTPAEFDETCDDIDDNCDGTVDEGYIETATGCGEGACYSTGLLQCVEGEEVNTCQAGTGAMADATCDNVDDDCDGQRDEEYVAVETECGEGACESEGMTSCSEGYVLNSCVAGNPAANDATCNGVDEDCNGTADEDYVPVATECGEGACAAVGATSCAQGSVHDSCVAETAVTEECNGADDDCDEEVDEGFLDTDDDGLADCIDPDDDDDEILDGDDNCPLVYNPLQEDSDRDNEGDACERDTDGDTILDDDDNCPTIVNLDQEDLNDDGEGDACDCDIDGDGVDNENPDCVIPEGTDPDNCGMVENPDQEDLNRDDVGDACQTFDIRHTGGCAAQSGGSNWTGAGVLLALMFGMLILFRFFRRRTQRTAAMLAFLTVVGVAAAADAQTAIPVQAFEPSPFKQDLFTAGKGYTLGQWNWDVGVMFDYQNSPLVLRYDDTIVRRIVEHQFTAHVFGAVGFTNWLDVGIVLPIIIYQAGESAGGLASPGNVGVGDLRIVPRFRLYQTKNKVFAIGVTPEFTAPTGNQVDPYMGSASWTFDPWVNLSLDFKRFGFVLDIGYRLVKDSNYQDIAVDDQIRGKFGFWVGLVPQKLDLIGELMVSTSVGKPFDLQATPIEPIGGLRWHAHQCVDVNFGGGASVTEGVAGPRFRLFAGVTYGCDRCGMDPDGDGIGNCDDACTNSAEDIDQFEDADGCPDADDDRDKVCDPWVAEKGVQAEFKDICSASDECPRDAGPAWNHGCPPPDGDADKDGLCDPWVTIKIALADYEGICKGSDKCPDVPGPVWNEGCPEANPDRDGDGVCDPWVAEKGVSAEFASVCKGSDQCPDQPEDKDGDADDDGCPEERAKVEGPKIVILEAVYFEYDKDVIIEDSYPVLREVAKILRENPQITKIRIEAHTDTQGKDSYNMKLSIARAKAVVKYLIDSGEIAENRLEWKGLGETQPIVSPENNADDQQKNRRVEFFIVEPAQTP